MSGPTIGIIGAGGWLGQAFAEALVARGVTPAENLVLSYRSQRPDILAEATWTLDNQLLADRADVILVSVRPEDFPALALRSSGKLVISVMAGITLASLSARFDTARVVRCLPNAGAEVGLSYTPWVATAGTSAADRALVRQICRACGLEDELAHEDDLTYFAGLTGSGPAFPALLAQAMIADAVRRGIDPAIARRAVMAVLVGTGRLIDARGEEPDRIVETFLAYRGTTAAAIDAMRPGLERAIAAGLDAAIARGRAMGQQDRPS